MILEELAKQIEKGLDKLNIKHDDITVTISNHRDLCDYQSNDLFKISKINNLDINELGNNLINEMQKDEKNTFYFKSLTFAKPGFLNITISDEFINKNLKNMGNQGHLGIEKTNNPETFVLDYGGPNVAKPLHVGHMRTAIVGESIKRIINYKGHKTISDVHLGDFGMQIGQVIYGVLEENKKIEDIDIKYLDYIYPKMSGLCKENEEIRTKCAEITKKLQDGNEEYRKYWNKIMEVSCANIKEIYKYLDVCFDYWYGESDSYKYLPEAKEILEKKNLLKLDDGALIVPVKKETDKKEVPPFMFQKSNGAYLYDSTDLATIIQRKQDFNPDHILYVVDNRQSLHFETTFRVSEMADIIPKSKLEFLGYGTVNGEDGKPYKTRSGNVPKLENLFKEVKELFINKKKENKDMPEEDIDKIANSILKFADLQNCREHDYIFDLNKFSDVTGKTGPYILYTYLRLNKITKNEKLNINNITNNIYNNYDRQLRIKMLELPLSYEKAFENRMPHFIADYIYDLCVLANIFYQQNHINGEKNKEKINDWLNIINLVEQILKEMLDLLVIDIPSKM